MPWIATVFKQVKNTTRGKNLGRRKNDNKSEDLYFI